MGAQAYWWITAGAAAALAVLATFQERRRDRRRDLDRPGWVPWPLVQVLAILAAVVAAVLAAHGG
jgi:hypothetical protein